MPKSSLEELRGQIAAGEYAIDPGGLAGTILSKFALTRRVARTLRGADEQGAAGAGRGAQARSRRTARPASSPPLKPRRARPS